MARNAAPSFVKSRPEPNEDTLKRIRDELRGMRDLEREISDAEDMLKVKRGSLQELQRKRLPELFNEAGVDHIGLPAEGNLPAYDAEKVPYVKASISADWDEERKVAAFDYLTKEGAGDLIKSVITVALGKNTAKQRKQLIAFLKKGKYEYSANLAVPWGTLTAWVKERVKLKKVPQLGVIGGDVGEVVKLKQRKGE